MRSAGTAILSDPLMMCRSGLGGDIAAAFPAGASYRRYRAGFLNSHARQKLVPLAAGRRHIRLGINDGLKLDRAHGQPTPCFGMNGAINDRGAPDLSPVFFTPAFRESPNWNLG